MVSSRRHSNHSVEKRKMADSEETAADTTAVDPESGQSEASAASDSVPVRKSKNLQEATQHLKEEALRRFVLEGGEETSKDKGPTGPSADSTMLKSGSPDDRNDQSSDAHAQSADKNTADTRTVENMPSKGSDTTTDKGPDGMQENAHSDGGTVPTHTANNFTVGTRLDTHVINKDTNDTYAIHEDDAHTTAEGGAAVPAAKEVPTADTSTAGSSDKQDTAAMAASLEPTGESSQSNIPANGNSDVVSGKEEDPRAASIQENKDGTPVQQRQKNSHSPDNNPEMIPPESNQQETAAPPTEDAPNPPDPAPNGEEVATADEPSPQEAPPTESDDAANVESSQNGVEAPAANGTTEDSGQPAGSGQEQEQGEQQAGEDIQWVEESGKPEEQAAADTAQVAAEEGTDNKEETSENLPTAGDEVTGDNQQTQPDADATGDQAPQPGESSAEGGQEQQKASSEQPETAATDATEQPSQPSDDTSGKEADAVPTADPKKQPEDTSADPPASEQQAQPEETSGEAGEQQAQPKETPAETSEPQTQPEETAGSSSEQPPAPEEAAKDSSEHQEQPEVADKPKDDEAPAAEEAVQEQAPADVAAELTEGTEGGMPANFFYKYAELVSKPHVTQDSGIPLNLMELHHSFGYDCKRRSNLHLVDKDTVVFIAGNAVEVLGLESGEQKYLHSTSGRGVGALTVHPSQKYFAVAEKGDQPNINIYEWPSMKLYRIMRAGTAEAYAFVDFNPSGDLLASVGSYPDFMLTIWDWKNEQIVLRSKAFGQDVFRVTFSPENEGFLTSSGIGHIRFWKMANTFTGLKLQGELGRFGKTSITDIEGYVELPDGKVLSGTEWGNLLLWEGGLIKVEIVRKGKKPCHQGEVEQLVMDEGELITIGADGCVRVWDFETVDTADTVDDTGLFEMEPMNELEVGSGVHLKSMTKSVDPEQSTMWYAQDANGGIWKLDLSFSHTTKAPEQLYHYHAGKVSGLSASPNTHLFATIGLDSRVHVYDHAAKLPLCTAKYTAGGSALCWAPLVVDQEGSTLIAGFTDGVVRVLTVAKKPQADGTNSGEAPTEISLQQAFKPHAGTVTAMALDSKGKILATGGEDKTIFFLTVGEKYEPIGFVDVPGPVACIEWSPESEGPQKLLVCCTNGTVVELAAPAPGTNDTSTTFKIEGLAFRGFTFKSIKSELRREEERKRKEEEREQRKKERERRRKIRQQQGLEDDEEEEVEEGEIELETQMYIPPVPSPILQGFYHGPPGTVWLSMGEFDAGYLYECKLPDSAEEIEAVKPGRAVPMLETDDTPITCISLSCNKRQILLGLDNGSVRIHPLEGDEDWDSRDIAAEFGSYWQYSVHDSQAGSVTQITTSFDDQFLFTAGADGNVFAFKILSQAEIDRSRAEERAKVPSAKWKDEDSFRRVEDIDRDDHYSIEDAKQKAEHDKMMRLAEEKKQKTRKAINQLRRKFHKLIEQNQELPDHAQLDRMEFELDPENRTEMELLTQDRLQLVHRELDWEKEKHSLALHKLKARFKDILMSERLVVHSFETGHLVSTFRLGKLSEEYYQLRREMEQRQSSVVEPGDFGSRRESTDYSIKAAKESEDEDDASQPGLGIPGTVPKKGQVQLTGRLGEKVAKALRKAEQAKKRREKRQTEWDALLSNKPDENYEDPQDLADIKNAQENMGDVKLKTAKDYTVPEHLRMNAEKKRNQLIVLRGLIHHQKELFNRRVYALRQDKISVIEQIQEHVSALEVLQSQLAPGKRKGLPPVPQLLPDELPEKQMEYDRASLLRFKKDLAVRDAAALKGSESGGGFGGFGGFGGGGKAPEKQGEAAAEASPPPDSGGNKQAGVSPTTAAQESQWQDNQEDLTPLEIQLRNAEEIRLLYKRDTHLGEVQELLNRFDAKLQLLCHEKLQLQVEQKMADLRHITLFEELVLLKEFEKRENVLADKVNNKKQERADMEVKVTECQAKLEAKKKDIDKLLDKERVLLSTFQASLGDNNKFADFLTKVFKKKIKRAKKKAESEEGSDDDSDDSDDESDWSSSEEEGSDEGGLDDSVCPPGCDPEMFDNVCQLRERRLDIEEALAEEKKAQDVLKKEYETLTKKARIMDSALKTAEGDLEAFQLEKQQKLNELDVVVPLRLHQVEHMYNGIVPNDLSPCLVFTSSAMGNLQHRIKELQQEKKVQKNRYKEYRQQHVQLLKDRKEMEAMITELEEKCHTMMMLKFGRIVDLERLESLRVNRNIEELKEKLRANELKSAANLAKWGERVQMERDRITELTRNNTQLLDQLNLLLGERKELETSLDARQKNLGGEYQGNRRADMRERQRLIQLVQLQAQEIEALKEEIGLLSRKGGHILPPAQPPTHS
ncbi:CFAP44 [Branchiostoma lanceolatum]|uniref:Cilia- and flagella-associated protein 44 n=1 Tax=Branchiostoma lanceolatum TaxID=7740 RepID=A0A8K0ETU0_BRALA|nr:CFAP44 [Branchiostoma lanceolatum]